MAHFLEGGLIRFLVISFLIIGLIEFLLRTFTYYGWEVHPGYSRSVISQIYGADEVDNYADVLEQQKAALQQASFIGHREKVRQSKFVTVTRDGVRCNHDGLTSCEFFGGERAIWVFGGSTTFGYGVKNSETVTAYLDRMMPMHSVMNLGVGHYYSTPERILFGQLITQYSPPAIAIFIDGLNDFYHLEVPDRSAFDVHNAQWEEMPRWERLTKVVRSKVADIRIAKVIYRLLEPDAPSEDESTPPAEAVDTGPAVRRMIENFRLRALIGDGYGIRVIQIIQPVPGFGIGHKNTKVPIDLINLGSHRNSTVGYQNKAQWLDSARGVSDVYDLSELLLCEAMYVDSVHYSSKFNELIAKNLKGVIDSQPYSLMDVCDR